MPVGIHLLSGQVSEPAKEPPITCAMMYPMSVAAAAGSHGTSLGFAAIPLGLPLKVPWQSGVVTLLTTTLTCPEPWPNPPAGLCFAAPHKCRLCRLGLRACGCKACGFTHVGWVGTLPQASKRHTPSQWGDLQLSNQSKYLVMIPCSMHLLNEVEIVDLVKTAWWLIFCGSVKKKKLLGLD